MSKLEKTVLPTDKQARKNIPMMRGLLDYFPNALAGVAEVSRIANEQHNPGEEMHWAWGKSNDHADCIVRHLVDRGTKDEDGLDHAAKVAWRALALYEEELVAAGAKPGRSVRMPEPEPVMVAAHEKTPLDKYNERKEARRVTMVRRGNRPNPYFTPCGDATCKSCEQWDA